MRNTRPEPRKTLAANLRHLRQARDWSQGELSRRSGVSQKNISNIENEEKQPTLATVDKLAAAFGLTLWHLIMPNLPKDLVSSKSIDQLFGFYTSMSQEGRDYLHRVAEREAQYGKRDANNTPPEDNGDSHGLG